MKTIHSKKSGFTIIEVLIVLAIAGLILLIVFLAVPAVNRNSRNTTAKNDVQNVMGGISEHQAANNGSMPIGVEGTGGIVTFTAVAGGNDTTAKTQGTTVVTTTAAAPADAPDLGSIQILIGQTCDVISNTRAAAAYYSIEGGSGLIRQCQDS